MNSPIKTITKQHSKENLRALATALDEDLNQALADLQKLFAQIDRRIGARIKGMDFPCHAACSACCNAAVRISFLEYVALIEYLRSQELLEHFFEKALTIIPDDIDPGDEKASDPTKSIIHTAAAQQTCPVLGDDGLCQAYQARPLVCRLFGLSFNEQGGLYACQLVGEKFAGQELRLPRAQNILQQIRSLPLTEKIDSIASFVLMMADEQTKAV